MDTAGPAEVAGLAPVISGVVVVLTSPPATHVNVSLADSWVESSVDIQVSVVVMHALEYASPIVEGLFETSLKFLH